GFDDPGRVAANVARSLEAGLPYGGLRVKEAAAREKQISRESAYFVLIGADHVGRRCAGNDNVSGVSLAGRAVARVEQADPGAGHFRPLGAKPDDPVFARP